MGYKRSNMISPLIRIGPKLLISRIAAKIDKVIKSRNGSTKKNL